jgi:Mg2+-importing ATPase
MDLKIFWQYEPQEIFDQLKTSPKGLSPAEALKRLQEGRAKEKQPIPFVKELLLFLNQFRSPLVLLLVVAVILAAILGEKSDAFIILFILLTTGILSFIQEQRASKAVEELKSIIRSKVKAWRDNHETDIFTEDVVPGDILLFDAGDIIPADCLLFESDTLQTNEAALTGETYPVSKEVGSVPADTSLSKRKNVLFEGSNVVSGGGKAVAVLTGKTTVFGNIAASISGTATETAFEKGIKEFGLLLMKITIALAVIILVVNTFFGRPFVDSLLFCLALAVGMAPELLPAVMTIAMSSGASRMAKQKVIVKKLTSIQNLGEVNLLCSDKTGTLTEGTLTVSAVIGIDGRNSDKVKELAFCNAFFATGFPNPIDAAMRKIKDISTEGYEKITELPYDFSRKRLSIVVKHNSEIQLITKGAVKNILEVCTQVQMTDGSIANLKQQKESIDKLYNDKSNKGFKLIGVCFKKIDKEKHVSKEDEQQMIFAGFVLLTDPPKKGVKEIIETLRKDGIDFKIITGDNALIASYIAGEIGLQNVHIITGPQIGDSTAGNLTSRIEGANVFAEIEPQQKEHIIKALNTAQNTVAYIGDGINDVTAISTADVGISINNAVDVARDAADIVLLEKDLQVLHAGIIEGRKTFLNMLKYPYTNTSVVFGNMLSMAAASLILPFFPMLPKQILLTNFLTDFPYMSLASDNVDAERLRSPGKWNLKRLKRFMIVFGLLCCIFDFITFFVLYKVFHAREELFHTGWFIESVYAELLILFVIRTRKALIKSKPGKLLFILSATSLLLTLTLTFVPFKMNLGFAVPSGQLLLALACILILYTFTADILKVFFFRNARQ